MGSTFCAHVPLKHEKIHMKAKPNPMVQKKMPPDRLNFANLIPSEKGVPNPNIPKKEKRPPKAKAYELIRLVPKMVPFFSHTSLFSSSSVQNRNPLTLTKPICSPFIATKSPFTWNVGGQHDKRHKDKKLIS